MSQPATMNGAEALLELFRAQGTDYIFCSPIAAWAPFWEALAKRKATTNIETPKYLNCRHEILAVGLASGYYKATGRTQAVLLPTAQFYVDVVPDGARDSVHNFIDNLDEPVNFANSLSSFFFLDGPPSMGVLAEPTSFSAFSNLPARSSIFFVVKSTPKY